MGTHGAGFTKAILGRAASELARSTAVPVLMVGRPDDRERPDRTAGSVPEMSAGRR